MTNWPMVKVAHRGRVRRSTRPRRDSLVLLLPSVPLSPRHTRSTQNWLRLRPVAEVAEHDMCGLVAAWVTILIPAHSIEGFRR